MPTAKKPATARAPAKAPAKPRTRKAAAPKAAATKAAPRKAPAPKPVAAKAAAPKATPKTTKVAAPKRRTGLIATIALGVIATGSAIALFGRRLLGPGNAEHDAPDLALDQPRDIHRAPDAFRPDPTAEVPASEREALRPALVH